MSQYLQNMNEAYIEKNYPNRSVFEAIVKTTKKVGIGVYIFFGIVFAGSIAGLVWSVNAMNTYKLSGETDMADVGMVICIFFAVLAIISALTLGITFMRGKKGAENWLQTSAKNSLLSESEIQEFERQAMASDSYILKLLDSANKAMSGGKDGILTRDFIYLADINLTVIRCKDLVSTCLVDTVIYVGSQQQRKPLHYLTLKLLSKNGAEAFAEISPDAANALVELLLQKYPAIDTCDNKVMTEQEYDKYKKTQSAKA